MKRIACLGPSGTYNDIATRKYMYDNKLDYEIDYYPSILKAIDKIDDNRIGIVPFENTLDGFVMEALDRIINNNLVIRKQIKLDIDFAFVANCEFKDVKEIYCQFKTYGQCLDFISSNNYSIVKTESNMDSFNRLINSGYGYGAIVPMHILDNYEFPYSIKHIADSKNNETRFVIVDNNHELNEIDGDCSVSLVITSIVDRPGILSEILEGFHNKKINLKSILSRPDRTQMGRYNFFIEFSLSKDMKDSFYNILREYENSKYFNITVLGVYEAL